MQKKCCKPYERLNLRLNEYEQVCNKNLFWKNKKFVRELDLYKAY